MTRSSQASRFRRAGARGLIGLWLAVPCLVWALVALLPHTTHAREAQWIWSPEHKQNQVPQSACHFRKAIYLKGRHVGTMEIAADDEYELYLNGKKVGNGESRQRLTTHEVTEYLKEGNNLIAIRVSNSSGDTAGLAASLRVRRPGENARLYLTNPTWRTSLNPLPMWNTSSYLDNRWQPAKAYGPLHSTPPGIADHNSASPTPTQQAAAARPEKKGQARAVPTDNRLSAAQQPKPTKRTTTHPRFKLPQGFQVQHVAGHEETGSLTAMTFNEFGQLLAAREDGPLLLIHDSNSNEIPDTVRVYCDQVKSCQGILSLSGDVYVVGHGPDGLGLYRLEDRDRDGRAEVVETLLPFEGRPGEHGPHGLALGPDGMIYLTFGNHTRPALAYAKTSPHRDYYEGDLLTPRYEDPRGHAAGMQAPGGGVLRLDSKADQVELVAGGLRNAYDLAFDSQGELFLHDSDMEPDQGTSWYRPTRLLHIVPSGEYGWRSGWAKWPTYYVDNLPATLDTGRSSPTGAVFYDHDSFPPQYANVMFTCDWSQGRILAIRNEPAGASFSSSSEVFLEGKPLNVTDVEVGPDGWLYFCTGGRGTTGNIYRVVFQDGPTPAVDRDSGVLQAIHQPQIHSAWSRQKVATLRHEMGAQWDREILDFALNTTHPGTQRAKALMLMHLVGPPPSDAILVEVSHDPDDNIRTTSAFLLGLISNANSRQRLLEMLRDERAVVRRHACEALARTQQQVPFETLTSMLASPDRFEAWSARRLLECNRSLRWHQNVFKTRNVRLFVQGAVAMLVSAPSHELAQRLLARAGELAGGMVGDEDFTDLLRVVQLAVTQGELTSEELATLAPWIREEFPAKNDRINHLLVPLIVSMQDGSSLDRLLAFSNSGRPSPEEQVFLITNLRFLNQGWDFDRRMQLIGKYEAALQNRGGSSLSGYVEHAMRDFTAAFDQSEVEQSLTYGDRFPEAAVAALHHLPEELDEVTLERLVSLDRRIQDSSGDSFDRLRMGIIAVLGRSRQPNAMSYLRELYELAPERRPAAAMGLAQDPSGRNWDYLVRSIPMLEGEAVREVLLKLIEADYAPESPEHIRQVIVAGLRLKEQGGADAAALLEHWVQERPCEPEASWDTSLLAWQNWFVQRYPDQPLPSPPSENGSNTWTFDDLTTYLSSTAAASGSPERGALVFHRAQCANCHRVGTQGDGDGPDLTNITRRFQQREILESIVYPSQVIDDQYASTKVLTNDKRTITGLALPLGDKLIVVTDNTGKKTVLPMEDVKEQLASRSSAMPEGLLNPFSLDEIADLVAYLSSEVTPEVAEHEKTATDTK